MTTGEDLLQLEELLRVPTDAALAHLDGRSDELARIAQFIILTNLGAQTGDARNRLDQVDAGVSSRATLVGLGQSSHASQVRELEQLVRADPESGIAKWRLAEVLETDHQWTRAQASYRELADETGSQLALLGCARCLSQMGEHRGALEAVDQLAPLWKSAPYKLFVESRIAARARDWERATRAYAERCDQLGLRRHPIIYKFSTLALLALLTVGTIFFFFDLILAVAVCLAATAAFLPFTKHMRPISVRALRAVPVGLALLLVILLLLGPPL